MLQFRSCASREAGRVKVTNVYGSTCRVCFYRCCCYAAYTTLLFRKRISTSPLLLFSVHRQINRGSFASDSACEILTGSIWDIRHVVRSTTWNTFMAEQTWAFDSLRTTNSVGGLSCHVPANVTDVCPARNPRVVSSWPNSEIRCFKEAHY